MSYVYVERRSSREVKGDGVVARLGRGRWRTEATLTCVAFIEMSGHERPKQVLCNTASHRRNLRQKSLLTDSSTGFFFVYNSYAESICIKRPDDAEKSLS